MHSRCHIYHLKPAANVLKVHPHENDFYLCSHAAIKGTARPTHYHVILNEAGMSNDELQTILYEQVYQYARATTPVSMHPAVYYAHIASGRAGTHDPVSVLMSFLYTFKHALTSSTDLERLHRRQGYSGRRFLWPQLFSARRHPALDANAQPGRHQHFDVVHLRHF